MKHDCVDAVEGRWWEAVFIYPDPRFKIETISMQNMSRQITRNQIIIVAMTSFQNQEFNLIMGMMQEPRAGPATKSRISAMGCIAVERNIRSYCRSRLTDLQKYDIFIKNHIKERLIFMKALHNYWSWVGHWGDDTDQDAGDVSWDDYLYNTMTEEELQITFKTLTNCTCCKRHEDINGINKQNYNRMRKGCSRTCMCSCRHHSRRLRRVLLENDLEVSYGDVCPEEVLSLRGGLETVVPCPPVFGDLALWYSSWDGTF